MKSGGLKQRTILKGGVVEKRLRTTGQMPVHSGIQEKSAYNGSRRGDVCVWNEACHLTRLFLGGIG